MSSSWFLEYIIREWWSQKSMLDSRNPKPREPKDEELASQHIYEKAKAVRRGGRAEHEGCEATETGCPSSDSSEQ